MRRAIFAVLLISTAAFAENRIEYDLGRGTPDTHVQAAGSSDPAGSRGTHWSVDMLHQTSGPLYFGLGGGYFHSKDYLSPTFVANRVTSVASKMTSLFLLTRTDLSANPRFQPYAIAGMGWVKNSLLIIDQGTDTRVVDDSHNTYGYAFGFGADLSLTDRLYIGVEARYQGSLSGHFDLTPAGQALTGQTSIDTRLNLILLGIKVGVRY